MTAASSETNTSSPSRHTLRATVLKPPADRQQAEWVVGRVERPRLEWVPTAFRPPA